MRAPSPAELLPYQQQVDVLADEAVVGLRPTAPQALLAAVEARAQDGHVGAKRFLDGTAEFPAWYSPALFEHGRRLVVELGTELALVLVTGGLVEGYASPSLSTPLVRTGRLRQDAQRRLYETGQMVHNARAPSGLAPDGVGRRTIREVRLLHATVRLHLEHHGYVGPDGGRALHALDMAHTATAFSHKGPLQLAQLGIHLTDAERGAMVHFWRVVNHLHGVPEELLPSTPEGTAALSQVLDEWRFSTEFAEGRALAVAALSSIASQPPTFLPLEALATLTYRCLPSRLANAWGFAPHPVWSRVLDMTAHANRGLTEVWRKLPGVGSVRARVNVGLYGRTLQTRLGTDPSQRAFSRIAGEEALWGPGLEPLTRPVWPRAA